MRSITMLAAAFVATATLTLTGACGGGDTTTTAASGAPSTPSAAPLSPADALAAAARHFGTTPHGYSLKAEAFTFTGSADPAAGKVLINGSMEILGVKATTEGRVDGKDWYVKVEPGPDAFEGKWLHLDPAKLKDSTGLGFQDVKDPSGVLRVVPALTATQRAADGRLTGTVDLSKVSGEVLYLDPTDVPDLGDKAKAVPFQATLDGDGRLTGLTFEIPGTDGDAPTPVTYAFTDWGKAVTVDQPAGAIEADDAVYRYFNLQI
ncbi:hypothetical protein Daura_37565 [Dactylosporangium aurantiacum]|uniref:Lipoprotein n=1 Tax=Dactylosporangium aurantiacum TaxID=35754 RepID=A0A9Q9MAX9_9ACTN|nr:hypothetical protein [Dactylosporangium aurantiacum]MDG6101873.1 hypothetical protein [Dactylosporangium aurantiacum]UWZ52328.1 hypothetical protein Daura_37565 [Dactylosporangium aurantiacum]